jgi:hypothetical protein
MLNLVHNFTSYSTRNCFNIIIQSTSFAKGYNVVRFTACEYAQDQTELIIYVHMVQHYGSRTGRPGFESRGFGKSTMKS